MTRYDDMMQKMTAEEMVSLIARQPCTRCVWENEDCNDKSCALGVERWLMGEEEKDIKAHWVREDEWGEESNTYKCSHCGEVLQLKDGTPQENGYNFCPHCGARMERG